MSFIVRRLVFYLVAAWVALTINFFIPRLIPGNAVESIMAKFPNLQPSAYRAIEAMLGVGQHPGSIWHQYTAYLVDIFHFNFGTSSSEFPAQVSTLLGETLPWTIIMVGTATVIAFLVGTALGIAAGWRHGGGLDRVMSLAAADVTPLSSGAQAGPFLAVSRGQERATPHDHISPASVRGAKQVRLLRQRSVARYPRDGRRVADEPGHPLRGPAPLVHGPACRDHRRLGFRRLHVARAAPRAGRALGRLQRPGGLSPGRRGSQISTERSVDLLAVTQARYSWFTVWRGSGGAGQAPAPADGPVGHAEQRVHDDAQDQDHDDDRGGALHVGLILVRRQQHAQGGLVRDDHQ
jgi:hypothetical protein